MNGDGFDDRSNLTNHTEANLVCWFQVINSTIDKFIKFIVLNLLYALKFIVPLKLRYFIYFYLLLIIFKISSRHTHPVEFGAKLNRTEIPWPVLSLRVAHISSKYTRI